MANSAFADIGARVFDTDGARVFDTDGALSDVHLAVGCSGGALV